jgi:hypothetical protein
MAWQGREGKVKDAAGEDAASRCPLWWAWSSARGREAAGGSGFVVVVVVVVRVRARARADGTAVVVPQAGEGPRVVATREGRVRQGRCEPPPPIWHGVGGHRVG